MAKASSTRQRWGYSDHRSGGRQPGQVEGIGQIAIDRAVGLDLDQADVLARRALADPDDSVLNGRGMHQTFTTSYFGSFRPGQPRHVPGRESPSGQNR